MQTSVGELRGNILLITFLSKGVGVKTLSALVANYPALIFFLKKVQLSSNQISDEIRPQYTLTYKNGGLFFYYVCQGAVKFNK